MHTRTISVIECGSAAITGCGYLHLKETGYLVSTFDKELSRVKINAMEPGDEDSQRSDVV